MTPDPQIPSPPPPGPSAGGINLRDMAFTLFRHKWLILAFFCAGVAGAVTVRILRPPWYFSEAKIMIPFVIEKPPGPEATPGSVHPSDSGGPSVLNTEVEILWSHDVISNAVRTVGAEKILARKKGGNDSASAAGVVSSGLEVEQPPKTQILLITFRNRDPNILQPVLSAVLENYMLAHVQYHIGADSDVWRKRSEEMKQRLAENEEKQRQLKTTDEVLNLETSKTSFENRLNRIRTDLYEAERDLAGRRAVLGETTQSSSTNPGTARVPSEIIEEYGNLMTDLAEWKRKDRDLAQQGMTSLHPARFTIQGQIGKLNQSKSNLLSQYAALAQFNLSSGSTNSSGTGLAADLAEIKRLTGSVEFLRVELTNVQFKVVRLLDLEAKLHELEREHSDVETNYNFLVRNLEMERASHALGGNLVNITTIEKPTPPTRDTKKLKKLLTTVFGGCVAAGLGLALLIDFVLDRSIKGRSDVERFLHLRVFQAIPDTGWTWRSELPWGRYLFKPKHAFANGHGENGDAHAVTVWDPVNQLFQHADGLRERLLTWFETENLSLKMPKMVGVTSCTRGSGVTTVASGLAASLSRIGNGNVLLVNISNNGEQAATRSFHMGQPGPGLQDNFDLNGHAEQQVDENLFVAPGSGAEPSNKLVQAQHHRLNHLIPNLKAGDYDYIIFDLPRVSQTSSTARVAGYMDIVLLVLESEKTSQQAASSANAMMKESRANVAAVLNKCRRGVPSLLSHDL